MKTWIEEIKTNLGNNFEDFEWDVHMEFGFSKDWENYADWQEEENSVELKELAKFYKEYHDDSKIAKAIEISNKDSVQVKKRYGTGYYFSMPSWREVDDFEEASYYANEIVNDYAYSDSYKNDESDIEYYGAQEEDDDEDYEPCPPIKRFELVKDESIELDGHILYRVKACKDFTAGNGVEVHTGDVGGYVEKEDNLEQEYRAWVFDDAVVYASAKVSGFAAVCGNAIINGHAQVCDHAEVMGNAQATDGAIITGHATVKDDAKISGKVSGDAVVGGSAKISDFAKVYSKAEIGGSAVINNYEYVGGNTQVFE